MTQPTGIACDPQQMADLTICDQEPIHTPGAIQPWGALLVVGRHDLKVTHCSANIAEWLGLSPEAVLGLSLDRVLGDEGGQSIRRALADERWCFSNARLVTPPSAAFPLQMAVHRMDGSVFIELEAVAPDVEQGAALRGALTVMQALHAASSQRELCAIVVAQLRQLTGYDRVMVYRFDREGHGEVVAEARDRDLEPYLGLRYPASDIPRQARRIYLAQRVRSIANVDYTPVPVLADPALGAHRRLDMTLCGLRSVSPIHLEYMRNMGTQASLGVSLILNNALWGMLVFHHRSPLAITADLRAQCDLIGQLVSLLLGSLGEAESYAEQLGRQRMFHEIVGRLADSGPVIDALYASGDTLLSLVQAGGAVIRLGERTVTLGVTPPGDAIQRAMVALRATSEGAAVAVDELQEILPDWSLHNGLASGALLLPLPPNAADVIIWFRPEIERIINWAGNPCKPTAPQTISGRLSPRHSFAAWQELVRGHSKPWQDADRGLAHELQRMVTMALAREAEAELAKLRYYDTLTGLPNRRMFEEQLDAQGVGPDTGLLYLDLDHFKAVNDTLGHQAGDALLRAVAERLSGCVRKGDLIVRLGGDEFVIVQAGGEQPFRSVALAQRVVAALNQPFELNGQQVGIGVSIGIALGQIGAVPDGLLRDADLAMYQAKAGGRGNYRLFHAGTPQAPQRAAAPEEDLHLERDPTQADATAFSIWAERTAMSEWGGTLERLLMSTSRAMIVTDDRQHDNPIVFINPAFTAMTGYSALEALGQNCRFLQGPATDTNIVRDIRDALEGGRSIRREILNYRKDGSSFWNDLTIDPIHNAAGELSGFVGEAHRISRPR
ncbi:diguanylate cyclase domain-containing protein [Thiocapsa sp. UBA6158]|uniref:diguanylate cyclase domain-containing protein n=1 Tax=Thiocapsa sp. UBA6158 TaxID=1947692 RepID=UPI0025CCD87E|nr:diguanylate cyclase [Thiocapsa sp. UBA6158]